jgi:protein pelota
MKLLKKTLEKDASGSVQLVAEEPEDMWHTYNLLATHDQLKCSTVR